MAGKSPKKRKTEHPQPDDFKSAARRLGCDDDKKRFEERLRGLVAKKCTNEQKR